MNDLTTLFIVLIALQVIALVLAGRTQKLLALVLGSVIAAQIALLSWAFATGTDPRMQPLVWDFDTGIYESFYLVLYPVGFPIAAVGLLLSVLVVQFRDTAQEKESQQNGEQVSSRTAASDDSST